MDLPEDLLLALKHGQEESYLEYKGNVSWRDNPKKLEIVQTIFSLANKREGGIIVIGVENDGTRVGLSDEHYSSYDHDQISQYIHGKTNQDVVCIVSKFGYQEDGEAEVKNFVFIQVTESREFPLVYTGGQLLFNNDAPATGRNIALRQSAIYIRSSNPVGNKEIETVEEWQELIERTYRKYEKETIRRSGIVDGSNPFDQELTI